MITNKTTLMNFIRAHYVSDVTMKDMRYTKQFSEKRNKHFYLIIDRNDTEYELRCVQYANGCIWSCVDEYVYDDDYRYLKKSGVLSFGPDEVLKYDSYHYNTPFISKQ